MNSDTIRWMGTTLIAGLLALGGVFFVGQLALKGQPIPSDLSAIVSAAVVGFIAPYGSMVGARASQNGQSIANEATQNEQSIANGSPGPHTRA